MKENKNSQAKEYHIYSKKELMEQRSITLGEPEISKEQDALFREILIAFYKFGDMCSSQLSLLLKRDIFEVENTLEEMRKMGLVDQRAHKIGSSLNPKLRAWGFD